MGRRKHPELFTPAEQRVLDGIRAGKSNVEIAIDPINDPAVELFHAGTAKRGGKLLVSGGRVMSVCAHAATLAEALAKAYQAVPKIRFEEETLGNIVRHRHGLHVPINQRSYAWRKSHVENPRFPPFGSADYRRTLLHREGCLFPGG